MYDHEGAVYNLISLRNNNNNQYNNSDHTLVSAGWDKTIKLWSLRTMSSGDSGDVNRHCIRTLSGHTDAVRSLVQLDDQYIASAGWDCTVRIWDLQKEMDENNKQVHNDILPAMDASTNNASIASSELNSSCVGILRGHSAWVYALAYIPSTQSLISGSGDKTLRVTDLPNMNTHTVLTGHENTIWALAALPGITTTSSKEAESDAAATSYASPSAATTSTATTGGSTALSGASFVSAGADGQIRLWDLTHQRCMRITGGHSPVNGIPSSIHALTVWPTIREDPAAAIPIRFKRQHLLKQSISDNSDTRAPLAAIRDDGLYCESMENRPLAMRSEEQGPVQLSSELEYTSCAKAPSGLERSVFGAVSTADHTSFEMVHANFLPAVDYDAIVAKAADAAKKALIQKQQQQQQQQQGATTTAATGTSAAPSPAAAAGNGEFSNTIALFDILLPMRLNVLAFIEKRDYVDAERILLQMIELVETEQEKLPPPISHQSKFSSSASVVIAEIPTSSLSSLLCCLLHDISLCAFIQCAYPAALRYGTRSLTYFEGDDIDNINHIHREEELKLLIGTHRKSTDDFIDMIPIQFTLNNTSDFPWLLFSSSSSSSSSSSASASASPHIEPVSLVFPPPSSIYYISLQLRRFYSSILSNEIFIAQRIGIELINRIHNLDQIRENIFDDIETGLLSKNSINKPPFEVQHSIPLHSLYAHIIWIYHTEILVAMTYQMMKNANELKGKGNQLFALANKNNNNERTTASGTTAAVAAATSSTTSDINKTNVLVPANDYVNAAIYYNKSIILCQQLEDILTDTDSCPSFMIFELAAAQIPTSTTSMNQNHRFAGSLLFSSSVNKPSIPPFSIYSLYFFRALLHSNFAISLLKLSNDSNNSTTNMQQINLFKTKIPLPINNNTSYAIYGYERGRKRGVFLQQKKTENAIPIPIGSPSLSSSLLNADESSINVGDITDDIRLLMIQRSCEAGIELMEDLNNSLINIREQIKNTASAINTTKYKGLIVNKFDDDDDNDDDEIDRNIYIENPSLGSSLPSLSECASLSSKLYFRHGCSTLDRGLDEQISNLSFQLAIQLQTDEKIKNEIKRKKQNRQAIIKKQQQPEHTNP
jgi:hypothetical protein